MKFDWTSSFIFQTQGIALFTTPMYQNNLVHIHIQSYAWLKWKMQHLAKGKFFFTHYFGMEFLSYPYN